MDRILYAMILPSVCVYVAPEVKSLEQATTKETTPSPLVGLSQSIPTINPGEPRSTSSTLLPMSSSPSSFPRSTSPTPSTTSARPRSSLSSASSAPSSSKRPALIASSSKPPSTTRASTTRRPGIYSHSTVAGTGSTTAPASSMTSEAFPWGTEAPPTQPTNSLTMLAFGVMSIIFILIIVMVILLTVISVRGRCSNSKEEGKKNGDSAMTESNLSTHDEKETITLVSVKMIDTATVYSSTRDNQEQEINQDLLNTTTAHGQTTPAEYTKTKRSAEIF